MVAPPHDTFVRLTSPPKWRWTTCGYASWVRSQPSFSPDGGSGSPTNIPAVYESPSATHSIGSAAWAGRWSGAASPAAAVVAVTAARRIARRRILDTRVALPAGCQGALGTVATMTDLDHGSPAPSPLRREEHSSGGHTPGSHTETSPTGPGTVQGPPPTVKHGPGTQPSRRPRPQERVPGGVAPQKTQGQHLAHRPLGRSVVLGRPGEIPRPRLT